MTNFSARVQAIEAAAEADIQKTKTLAAKAIQDVEDEEAKADALVTKYKTDLGIVETYIEDGVTDVKTAITDVKTAEVDVKSVVATDESAISSAIHNGISDKKLVFTLTGVIAALALIVGFLSAGGVGFAVFLLLEACVVGDYFFNAYKASKAPTVIVVSSNPLTTTTTQLPLIPVELPTTTTTTPVPPVI